MMEVETGRDSGETPSRSRNPNKYNHVEATWDEIGLLEARSRLPEREP
jgi:hypothetical protein